MVTPDNKSIEEAKAFLRTRLSAEQSMSRHLEDELYKASLRLIEIAKKYGVSIKGFKFSSNRAMKREVDKVLQDLKDALYEDMETLCVYADEDDKDAIIAYINAEYYNMNVKTRISNWVDKFRDNIEKVIGEEVEDDTIKKMASYFGLDRLLRHTIGRAYMNSWYRQHQDAIGFYAYRGSRYPCELCDSYVGFHTMDDYQLPLHPRCCCYAVFIY